MEHTSINDLQSIINQALKNSITYEQYRTEIANMVANNATSGKEQTQDLIDYTLLNDKRMKRWDKTIKVTDAVKAKVANFKGDVIWLVLTESWCGDAAHVVPVIHKIAELSEHIALRLIYRDVHEALMNHFLTNGGKSIPKLIMIDKATLKVMGAYGPRPSGATQLITDYLAEHGEITEALKEDLQRWYNTDKGQNVMDDLMEMI